MILLLFVLGEISMVLALMKWGFRGGVLLIAGEVALLTVAVMTGLVRLV